MMPWPVVGRLLHMSPMRVGRKRPVHGRNQEIHIPLSSVSFGYLQSLKKSIMFGIQLHLSDVIPILLGERSMWLHTNRLTILNTFHILRVDSEASSSLWSRRQLGKGQTVRQRMRYQINRHCERIK